MLRAIGVRLLVWGGLMAAILLYSGHLRWPAAESEPSQPVGPASAPETPAGPGWPHVRGPLYSGVSEETGLADHWPAGGPALVWKREIGRGYSAMTAAGNRLFTQRQTATEQSVLCLDAQTGVTVWEYRYGWAYEPGGMYPGPRATPTWHAGRVYFAAPDGLIGCLRAEDGTRVWEMNVNKQFGGRGTDFGYACSPLVEAGKVILPVGGERASVVALSAIDGSTVWTSGSEPASYCSAIPITFNGGRLVVAFLQNALALVDLESGKWLWQREYSKGYDEHAAIPVYREPHLMVMSPFQAGADLFRLEAPATTSGGGQPAPVRARLVWHGSVLSNDTASSVLVGGHVYGFDLLEPQTNGRRPSRGQFKCLEFPGGKVRWTTDRVGHATVLAADGKLYLFNDRGTLIVALATSDRYEELGRTAVFRGEMCWTSPALHRGRIYVRSPTQAACLDVATASPPEPSVPSGAALAVEPAMGEPFDVIGLIGKEREFPFDPPDLREFTRWYAWSLCGALLAAWATAGLAAVAARQIRAASDRSVRRFAVAFFWSAAIVLGFAATPLANKLCDGFTFTWPASLFVVHQIVLTAVAWSSTGTERSPRRWLAPLAALVLAAVFAVYYDLCRRLNLALAWVFLAGFPASWPLAVPLAYRLGRFRGLFLPAIGTIGAFSLYFWASAALLWLRAALVR